MLTFSQQSGEILTVFIWLIEIHRMRDDVVHQLGIYCV